MTYNTKPKSLQHRKTHIKNATPNQKNDGVDLLGTIIMAMLILPIIPP